MQKLFSLCLLVLLTVFACKHESVAPIPTCVEQLIIDENLIPYTGQSLDCYFFYAHYELDSKTYFGLDGTCVDMISTPFDCDGVLYDTTQISYFYTHAVYKGIVGILP
jgi:hypothetical protein